MQIKQINKEALDFYIDLNDILCNVFPFYKLNNFYKRFYKEIKKRNEQWESYLKGSYWLLPIFNKNLAEKIQPFSVEKYNEENMAIFYKKAQKMQAGNLTWVKISSPQELSALSDTNWCTHWEKTYMMFNLGTFYIGFKNKKPKLIFYDYQNSGVVDNVQHTRNNEIIPKKYLQGLELFLQMKNLKLVKYKINKNGDLERQYNAWKDLQKII